MPMQETQFKPTWHFIGATVRGASHQRSGLPNQDAYHCLPQKKMGRHLVAAVSDGHGSAKCFRSDIGANFAVKVATEIMLRFVEGAHDGTNLSALKRRVEEQLPRSLVRRWQ